MTEDKNIETLLAQTSMEEAEELHELINMLNAYEKREFIGFMRGAKLIKTLQAKQEVG